MPSSRECCQPLGCRVDSIHKSLSRTRRGLGDTRDNVSKVGRRGRAKRNGSHQPAFRLRLALSERASSLKRLQNFSSASINGPDRSPSSSIARKRWRSSATRLCSSLTRCRKNSLTLPKPPRRIRRSMWARILAGIEILIVEFFDDFGFTVMIHLIVGRTISYLIRTDHSRLVIQQTFLPRCWGGVPALYPLICVPCSHATPASANGSTAFASAISRACFARYSITVVTTTAWLHVSGLTLIISPVYG